jgi:diguanylate cyclase (GGDEF)-like protein/PAS domain S-box-containing protein
MPLAGKVALKAARDSPLIRFATLTLIAFVALGLGVVAVVGRLIQDQAVADARQEATSFAELTVRPHLTAGELRHGLTGSTRHELDDVLRQAHAEGEFPRIKVWNRDHRVVFSDVPAENGRVLPRFPELDAAFGGRVTTKLGRDRNDPPSSNESDIPYQAYVPLSFGRAATPVGVVEVEISQDQLAVGLRGAERNITIAIAAFLVLLYAVLVLIRGAGVRASRRDVVARSRLAAIVDASDDVIISTRLDGRVLSWNRGAERVYGYRADETLGRTLAMLLPPDRPGEIRAILDRAGQGERLEQFETKRVRKDGRTIDVSLSISPIYGSDSKVAGAAVIARDITAAKRADEELRRSQAQLAAAQQLANLGSWTWEIGSGEVTWSPEMFAIWGLDEATHEPSYEGFLGSLQADDRPAIEEMTRIAVAEGRGYEAEFRIVRPDRTVHTVVETVRVTVDGSGASCRMYGSVLDVTEQKEAEAALRRSAAELEARALKDPLTGLLNHGGFHEALDREIARCRRYGGRFSLILLDLDGFKPINDTFGHAEGDRVLREAAEQLAATCRPADVAGRLGGDEFALLLPETSGADAARVGERVQRAIADLGAEVGISFGIGQWPEDGPGKETVLFRADMALYAAKPASRDGSRLDAAARLVESMAGGPAGQRDAPADADESVRRILDSAREQLGMDLAFVSEFVGEEQVVRSVQGSGGPPALQAGARLRLDQTYCQRVVTGELSGVVTDARNDPRVNALPITRAADIGSYVGVPVRFSDGRLYGTLCCASRAPSPMLAERDASLMRVLARLVGDRLEHMAHEAQSRRMELEVESVGALLSALDARDSYTSEHSSIVVSLSRLVGQEIGVSGDGLTELEQAARLHDIGKLGVPDSILQKAGPLTDAEWVVMREHPRIGAEIVSSIAALAHLAPLVRAEHERWDGTGYPDRLAGEAIPLASRIVLACDAYHAMTSDRPYRDAMPLDEARMELERHAGAQFDPAVVDALLHVLDRNPDELEEQQEPLPSHPAHA